MKKNKEVIIQLGQWVAVCSVCFAMGYFISDDSVRIVELESALEQIRRTSANETTNAVSAYFSSRNARLSKVPAKHKGQFINEEERKHFKELDRRRRAGEIILSFEMPGSLRHLEGTISNLVLETQTKTHQEYSGVFTALGIPVEKANLLISNIAKIQAAALVSEQTTAELLRARREFNKRIRSLMTDDEYQRYREFESQKPAVTEFDGFRKWAWETRGIALNLKSEDATIQLFRSLEGFRN